MTVRRKKTVNGEIIAPAIARGKSVEAASGVARQMRKALFVIQQRADQRYVGFDTDGGASSSMRKCGLCTFQTAPFALLPQTDKQEGTGNLFLIGGEVFAAKRRSILQLPGSPPEVAFDGGAGDGVGAVVVVTDGVTLLPANVAARAVGGGNQSMMRDISCGTASRTCWLWVRSVPARRALSGMTL